MPILIALNMNDVAEHRGILTDIEKLSHALQSPIITTTAREGKGIQKIVEHIHSLAVSKTQ